MNAAPLLVVLPTHPGDFDNTERLIKWIVELQNVSHHSLLIAADGAIPTERVKALLEIARTEFYTARAMVIQTGAKGWPLAANLMFRAVARQIHDGYKADWLWLEPDAVPLRATWLNELAEGYRLCTRPFMGCLINNETPSENLPARYMSGVAIWPQNTYARLESLWKDARFTGPVKPAKLATDVWQKTVRAWDMVSAPNVVPIAQHTNLIQSHWGLSYGEPPVFVAVRTEADPPNAVTLDFVKRDAVLFHRVKTLDAFLPMWRIRMEHAKALVTESLKPTGASQYVLEKALEAGLIEAPGAGAASKKKPAQKQAELATA